MKSLRTALWVWYRGEPFRGFQSQREGPTVQDTIAQALAKIGISSTPCPAGRTDKGVHARMQVLSLRLRNTHPEELSRGLSAQSIPGLGICYARCAANGFHAQWSSVGKEYRYRLWLDSQRSSRWGPYSWTAVEHPRLLGRELDLEQLAQTLCYVQGTHDFAAFHESSSPRRPRTIRTAKVVDLGAGLVEIRICGDRFARRQVRFIVGSAVGVSAGVISEDRFLEALGTARPFGGIRAPAAGLILWEVQYPPGLDPFGATERDRPQGLPEEPPFRSRHN